MSTQVFPRLAVGGAVVMAALVILLASGCGSSEEPEPGATAQAAAAPNSSFDPCALLTKEEVEAAVSWTVAKTTPYVNGDRGHCVYESEKGMLNLEQVEVGVIDCFTNNPCPSDLPKSFATSTAMADFRKKMYEGSSYESRTAIKPIEGLGVPALMHEMLDYHTIEMWLGYHHLAYASTWKSEAAARSLGEKVLARLSATP